MHEIKISWGGGRGEEERRRGTGGLVNAATRSGSPRVSQRCRAALLVSLYLECREEGEERDGKFFWIGRGDMQDFCGLLAKDARCLAEQSRGACRAKVQRCNSGNSYSSRLRPYRWSGWALWMGLMDGACSMACGVCRRPLWNRHGAC